MIYRLTRTQRTLLQSLVHFIREGKLKEPIGAFPLGNPPTAYAIYLRGQASFIFENYGDLDALCLAGMLRFSWNRTGMGKLYYLTEEGSTAVQQNFKGPTTPLGFDVYLPDVLAVMSGDQLEIKRLPAVSLSELVNDVPLRRLVVEVLLERLLTAVKPLLSKEDFTSYHTLAGQFRDCLLHRPLPKDELKDLYQTLSFWGDIQIGTKFMAQAQALLYALWLLAALRLEELRQAE